MQRRDFLRAVGCGAAGMALFGCANAPQRTRLGANRKKTNIVYIIADDLGYAEVGCYGQKKIKTPNIDKLANQGMKFTQHYSGNPVCAPSRCVLMTGKHSGHAQVRGNKQVGGKEGWKLGATTGGQWPLKAGTVTVAGILKDAGYRTGAFGKWGLGRVGTTGEPNKQDFDHFFGYNCQRQAHTYYPNHLWRDGKVEWIEANKDGKEGAYSHDLIANEALKFVKANKDRPFFLYVPFTIPHVALQVPEDSLAEYKGKWPDPPYTGDKGYFPHPNPRACYAAMVTRMDRDVGRIMSLLKELNLEDNTIVMFTSDNGPTFNGGSDSAFFESARPLHLCFLGLFTDLL
jgi:arylsulfatase